MSEKGLGAAALVVAVAALGVALLGRRGGVPSPSTGTTVAGAPTDARLVALEDRVARLERGMPADAGGAGARVALEGADETGAPDARLAALEDRLQRLEDRAWSVQDLKDQGFRVLRLGYDQATLDAWTARATDASASEDERVAAFARLRGQVRDDASDARLPALASMLALAGSTADPGTRAAIYDALPGMTDPSLREPLVDSLGKDPSPLVRAAAATVLHSFRSDPDVHAALDRDLQQDADEHVKDAAFEALYDQPRRAASESGRR